MELASTEMLEKVLAQAQQRPVNHARCSPAGPRAGWAGTRKPLHPRPRCRCGQCRQCLDDARWERIFTEKFADPDYYAPRVIRFASPLG